MTGSWRCNNGSWRCDAWLCQCVCHCDSELAWLKARWIGSKVTLVVVRNNVTPLHNVEKEGFAAKNHNLELATPRWSSSSFRVLIQSLPGPFIPKSSNSKQWSLRFKLKKVTLAPTGPESFSTLWCSAAQQTNRQPRALQPHCWNWFRRRLFLYPSNSTFDQASNYLWKDTSG